LINKVNLEKLSQLKWNWFLSNIKL